VTLILKRAPVGQNPEDYSVLENGFIVGRIFHLDGVGPEGRPWMWASGPQRRHQTRGARLRADARRRHGGVR
jgi:hypothetical protein